MLRPLGASHQLLQRAKVQREHGIEWPCAREFGRREPRCPGCDPHALPEDVDTRRLPVGCVQRSPANHAVPVTGKPFAETNSLPCVVCDLATDLTLLRSLLVVRITSENLSEIIASDRESFSCTIVLHTDPQSTGVDRVTEVGCRHTTDRVHWSGIIFFATELIESNDTYYSASLNTRQEFPQKTRQSIRIAVVIAVECKISAP